MAEAFRGDRAPSVVRDTAAAARAFVESLEPEQVSAATSPFDSADRREFTYLPGPRPGLSLGEMSAAQQERALELLAAGLSERGFATARAIIELDGILAEIERAVNKPGWERRDPGYYWFRVYGDPGGAGPWAWRVGGHHLAVHLTVVDGRLAGTPLFFGANPATVPPDHRQAGLRTLPDEEDLGRALAAGLVEHDASVICDPVAPWDIVTRHDPVADAGRIGPGLAYADMDGEHRELLVKLVRHYLGGATGPVADQAWAEIEKAGLGAVTFRWAGPVEPGHGHYYAVMGPTFLLEYDNVQNDTNHIHTVWRDLRRDWGDDLLAEHHHAYRH